jgi:hypothetical protein
MTEHDGTRRAWPLDDVDVDEQLESVRLLLTAAAQRLDRLWVSSALLRDGPLSEQVIQTSRTLHRAVSALAGTQRIGGEGQGVVAPLP